MSWNKIKLVLRREYFFNFKRPSFLFTAFGVPALTLVAMFVIIQFTANRETNLDAFQQVGYVDRAGIIADLPSGYEHYVPVVDPALDAPGEDATDGEKAAYYDALEDTARQQLEADTLDAYLVIPDTYTLTGVVDVYAERNIPGALSEEIESLLRTEIAARAPADLPVSAERLSDPAETVLRDLDTDKELSEAAVVGRILLPFLFVFLYFMATNTTAQFLMGSVVEEKENRLMEILATSIKPLELLWGKLLGLGALALTQIGLWLLAGIAIASLFEDARDFISGSAFDPLGLVLVLIIFVLNFGLFSAIMLGIGASVTAEAESRQVAGIFTFISVLPIALLTLFFMNPNGALPMVFTFFPLTAGVGLVLRMGLTSVPPWQVALSVAIQVISTVGVMWLAAKAFRLGMLMYGQPLTPRALWRALREGRTVLTTATAEMDAVSTTRRSTKQRSLFRR